MLSTYRDDHVKHEAPPAFRPAGLAHDSQGGTSTAEGERLAIEAESEGITVTGKRYEQKYHFLMRVRDGKIVEFKEYMDTEYAREVLVGS